MSSCVGPVTRPLTASRTIAAPGTRVVSAGLSMSVGPVIMARAAFGPNRPPSRGSESSCPSSTEAGNIKPTMKPKRPAWDIKGRLEDMELAYAGLTEKLEGTIFAKDNKNELLTSERARCKSLQSLIAILELETSRARLQVEIEHFKDLQSQLRREYDLEKEDSLRHHHLHVESLHRDFEREIETVIPTLKLQYEEKGKKGREKEEIRCREQDVREIGDREGNERDSLYREINAKEREIRILKNDMENLRSELEREQGMNRQLRVSSFQKSS